jgi:hypothetical protein
LWRTHPQYLPAAGPDAATAFPSKIVSITFALDFKLDTVAPNGVLFEAGDFTVGTALWLDNVLGTLGFAAGTVLATPDNGVSGTTLLNHLGVSSAVVAVGGTGHATNDLITLAGGTFTRAAVLRVTAQTAGVIDTVSVADRGVYSVLPANPVAQGSTSGTGVAATFTLTGGLVRTGRQRLVCSIVPHRGSICVWIDGHMRINAKAVAGTFGSGGWMAGAGNMGIGAVVDTITDRVPVASRVALVNASILGYLSVYYNQRPRHHGQGKLT